jgi:hypothetical protein
MTSKEPSCQRFVELVTDYLETTLPPDSQSACDQHLSSCGPCQTYLEQMRQTILALGQLIDATVPAETRDELIGRFRSLKAS